MKILLCSSGGIGAWFLLRLMREGHACDWVLLDDTDKPAHRRILKGLVPPPLDQEPDPSAYNLVLFDSTGHGELAEEISKVTPVIGDSLLASRLEDDRLFGIEIMEQCGIEVPEYAVFDSPDVARQFIKERPKRYVFKPFAVEGEEQDCDTTYVSDGPDDLMKAIDSVWKDAHEASFLLQEVVDGTEISTEAYFDGSQFYFHNHTLEEKKFMPGNFGPNTGCAGNLVWATNGPGRLFQHGLGKLRPFLRDSGYRGMIDLNTIVNENHVWGLEWTPRFGYDASASIFSLMENDLGEFLYRTATGSPSSPAPDVKLRAQWAASERLSIPPYPEEKLRAAAKLPVKGIKIEDAWLNCYLHDVMIDVSNTGDEPGLVTAGSEGWVASPIGYGHNPEAAWSNLRKLAKNYKMPNMQVRTDCQESTLKRLQEARAMGWIT